MIFVKKRSPENFGIKTKPLESYESMATPCP